MPVLSFAGRKGRYRRTLSCTTNGRRDATVGAIIFAGRQHELERRTGTCATFRAAACREGIVPKD